MAIDKPRPKTLGEKQQIRYRIVYIALATLVAIPTMALGLLLLGVDPSSASGIFSTSAATLSAIIAAHLATTPKNDSNEDGPSA